MFQFLIKKKKSIKTSSWDFHGGPVVKIPPQGTRVECLAWEGPATTSPRAVTAEARVESALPDKGRHLKEKPTHRNSRKPACSSEGPNQPKIKYINQTKTLSEEETAEGF